MKRLGEYTLGRPLGCGATAQVYLATRDGDGKKVALKVFHPGLWEQKELRARAMAEARAVSSLQHPGIVQFHETLWDQDPPAVALEFIDGVSLEGFQARLPYVLPEVSVAIIIEVLKALEFAHANGIIHRDLKPANILVSHDGRVLVSDFGLAKMVDFSRVTMSGAILGSPDYMAPEQAKGDITTARSDLFSVAAILYFLVTGTRPFTRHTPLATLAAVSLAEAEPAQKRNPKLSAALAKILNRGLSRNTVDRYASARDFRLALEQYLMSLGLNPDEFSLPAWVSGSSDSTLNAMKSIASGLALRAESEIAEQKWEEALASIVHLSQVAPESAALPRLLSVYESSNGKKKRAWLWGASAAAVVLVCVGAALKLHSPVNAPNPAPVSPAPVAAPVVASAPVEPKALPAPAPVKIKKPAEKYGVVQFDVAKGIHVFWNDLEIDPSKPLEHEKVGPHNLRLVKDGNPPVSNRVVVSADEPTVIRVH